MSIERWAAGLGIVAAMAIPAVAWSRATRPGEGGESEHAARIAAALQGKTFSLVDAIRAAQAAAGGTPIESEVEVEEGRARVEVVLLQPGPHPELVEVEIDGATNKVLEIERGDDDGGGEDHEGDDDDDEGDEKDDD